MLSCRPTISTTLRIYWFSHQPHIFATHRSHTNKSIRRLSIIINLLKFVVLSSLRCLVPVRFCIIVTMLYQRAYLVHHTGFPPHNNLPPIPERRSTRTSKQRATSHTRKTKQQSKLDIFPISYSICLRSVVST